MEGYNNLPFESMREVWTKSDIAVDSEFLKIEGHPVMESWETPFMNKLAEVATLKGGVVLEVGLGMAISARAVQKNNPGKHLIIELNEQVVKQHEDFLKSHPSIEVLLGDCNQVIDSLPDDSLDGVLYDTYPMSKHEQHTHQFGFISKCRSKLKSGSVLTYCNLTSLGILYSEFESSSRGVKDTWENVWTQTQKPHLLASGWLESELSYSIFELPQEAIDARGKCEYYSHLTCLVPKLVKS